MRNLRNQIKSSLLSSKIQVRELTRGGLAATHDHAGHEDRGEKNEGSHDEGDEGEEDGAAEGAEDDEPVSGRSWTDLTEEENFEVCISRARLKSLTEAKVGRDAGRVAVRAGAGGLAADADVARGHAGIVRLHSVEGILDEES